MFDITISIRNDANAGTADTQYVTIVGDKANTPELECKANFNVNNQDVTCQVKASLFIGAYTCVKWKNGGGDSLEFTQVN